jgi:hypothetical protein
MKKWIPFLAVIISLSACKEYNDNLINYAPVTPKSAKDTTYVNNDSLAPPQNKNVLIEDLTGDQCPNCPNAALQAQIIESNNPGRIFTVAEHSGTLSEPNPGQKYTFRIPEADNILNLIGTPGGYPMGAVDRTFFTGETNLEVTYQSWPGHVSTELSQATPVNLTFTKKSLDRSSNKLDLQLKTEFTSAVSNSVYLTVAVLESGMVDKQKTPTGLNNAYVFRNVMRKTVTDYNGNLLGKNPEKGRTYITNLSTTINPLISADSCSIVAFVHYRGNGPTDNQQVLQVQGTGMTK